MRSLLFAPGIGPGSVVLVTGATSGIGEATALRLAGAGHHLVLVARGEDALADVAARCRLQGAPSAVGVPTDVSDDDAVHRMADRIRTEHGRLDAVAHCAGEVTYGRTEQTSAEVFDRVVSTNLAGAANIARHTLPMLREREHAVLLLVGSLLGQVTVPEMTPYVVSKWAVRALARQLQVENLDHRGLRVVHLSPGSVDTPIYDRALESAGAVNQPPPPTISPERVARTIVRELEHPLRGSLTRQTAWSNHVLTAGFRAFPWAYDRLIGPVFKAASRTTDEAA